MYESVTVKCPDCGSEKKFYAPPIDRCRRCDTDYPDAIRQSAEATLAVKHAPRPALLTVGMYLSAALAALCLLSLACAMVGAGEYYVNDVQVTGAQFLAFAGLPLTAVGLIALVIAYSLFRDLWWSRRLIVVSSIGTAIIAIVASLLLGEGTWVAAIESLLGGIVILGPAMGYLFYHRGAVAYYDARRAVARQVDQGP